MTPGAIITAVERHYRVGRREIFGRCRKKHIVRARHVAIYLAWRVTGRSLRSLGLYFGRDNANVLHARRKIGRAFASDEATRAEIIAVAAGGGIPFSGFGEVAAP